MEPETAAEGLGQQSDERPQARSRNTFVYYIDTITYKPKNREPVPKYMSESPLSCLVFMQWTMCIADHKGPITQFDLGKILIGALLRRVSMGKDGKVIKLKNPDYMDQAEEGPIEPI